LIATLLFSDQGWWWDVRVDWGLSDQDIEALASMMRLDAEAVAALDIRHQFPSSPRYWFTWREVYPDLIDRTGDRYSNDFIWSWCPHCLADGFETTGQDYIRRDWISAYASYCQIHRQPLVDSCACGLSRNIIHVSEGAATKLYCRECLRRLTDVPAKTSLDAGRYDDAVDLQLAFERDLASSLNGLPSPRWGGDASKDALLTVVDNVVHALCTRAAYAAHVPIEYFDCFDRPRFRFPRIGDTEHKLCALRLFWRWRAIAATLAVIGDEATCRIMSRRPPPKKKPPPRYAAEWRGSFEWLLPHLTEVEIEQFGRQSPLWPREIRERFFLAAAKL
jgi:hypothetical protein